MGFLFRLVSSLFLALGVIVAIVDASRSIAASRLVPTSLADACLAAGFNLEASLRTLSVSAGVEPAWSAITVALLSAPAILVFVGLALIFYAIGYRRRREPRHMLHA